MLKEDDLLYEYQQRLAEYSAPQARMREINDIVNGTKDVPLPELDTTEKSAVPNIARQGLESQATRIASYVPDTIFPALRPNIESSVADARFRREIIKDWDESNHFGMKLRKIARWLKGYGSAPFVAMPNDDDFPLLELRSPLNTYPSLGAYGGNYSDTMTPESVIFTYAQRYDTLVNKYPDAMAQLRKPRDTLGNTNFELIEYIDGDQYLLAVLSTDSMSTRDLGAINQFGTDPSKRLKTQGWVGTKQLIFLKGPVANTAEICWAVIPGLITLDRVQGAYDNIVGMHERFARLMALESIATERGILPEIWIEQNPGEVVDFDRADPRKGKVGVIKGGKLNIVRPDPSMTSLQSMDRIERAMRIDSGTPPQLSGEAQTGIRTGRLNDTLISAAIDFDIQESQEILAEAKHQWNLRAIAIQKATKKKTISFSPPSRGVAVPKEYVPADIFPDANSTKHIVRYAVAGTDLANLAIGGLQRVGAEELSHRTFMENDPWVTDPEYETNQIIYEKLVQIALASLSTEIQSGAFPFTSLIDVIKKFQGNKDFIEAFVSTQQELQDLQAQQPQPGDPNAQPGLNNPLAGGQAGAGGQPGLEPSIPQGPAGVNNLMAQLTALRLGQRTAPGESVTPQRAAS